MTELSTQCCIAGGGPAGMMAALLLARAGVEVIVLEKHADFLRDFRGDTIHPSTLELLWELGWLDDFLKLPHQKARSLSAKIANHTLTVADFSRIRTHCRFIALLPQWDFLNFLAERARQYPTFRLLMATEAKDLLREENRITGIEAESEQGRIVIRADLVIGADGRDSIVRQKAGLKVDELGAPMDVLWFRLSRRPDDPAEMLGRIDAGRMLVLINRGEHWQCGYVISKGTGEALRRDGLEQFRDTLSRLEPLLSDRVSEIRDWADLKTLTVRVNRLQKWHRPGLLCIGDAAHAMSPVGGVGINLAVQDAVASANILARSLRTRTVTSEHLRMVQKRRSLPTRCIQAAQLFIQKRVISRVLALDRPSPAPVMLRLVARSPALQHMNAYLIGIGIRPEHIAPINAAV